MQTWFYQIKSWIFKTFVVKGRTFKYQTDLMERLSHELRTSLTGVVGYSEFVESTSTEPMINFTAKIIRESSQVLVRASNSFFDLHRLEQRNLLLNCQTFSIASVIRDVVRSHQKQANDLGLNLLLTCSDDLLLADMFADKRRVRQVVDALVFDSLQKMEKGQSIHVDVSLLKKQHQIRLVISWLDSFVDESQIALMQDFWSNPYYKFRLQEGPGVELALAKSMIYFLQGTAECTPNSHTPQKLIVTLPMRFRSIKVCT